MKISLLLLFIIQLIFCSFSLVWGSGFYNELLPVVLLIFNYAISIIICNYQAKNIFNMPTFFLAGFGFLILGRFFAHVISPDDFSLSEHVYCAEFFINYCLNDSKKFDLLMFLHVTLLAFTSSFVFKNKKIKNTHVGVIKNTKILILVSYFLSVYLLVTNINKIVYAMQNGYMSLYASQGEAYQTPLELILFSLLIASLGLLFSSAEKDGVVRKHFNVLISIVVVALVLTILTGARANFISAIILVLWLFFRKKTIMLHHYVLFLVFMMMLFANMDVIANFSGARDFLVRDDFIKMIADNLFSQGSSLLIMDAALNLENPPTLGYIKTIIPGVQILFSMFGIYDRHFFDWSSYMAYINNQELYFQGFGLGWSLFADLYLLAFKFMPLYIFFIIFWGMLLKSLSLINVSSYNLGLQFIFVFYTFSISRASISPLIFVIVLYSILFFIFSSRSKL